MVINRSSSSNTSIGHNETHAAQPKQRVESNWRISPPRLAMLVGGGLSSQNTPSPLFLLELYLESYNLILTSFLLQYSIFNRPISSKVNRYCVISIGINFNIQHFH